MKKAVLCVIAAALVSTQAVAEDKSKSGVVADVVTAFVLGPFYLLGATVVDKKAELCAAMGGTYTPDVDYTKDQCPKGHWAYVPLPSEK